MGNIPRELRERRHFEIYREARRKDQRRERRNDIIMIILKIAVIGYILLNTSIK